MASNVCREVGEMREEWLRGRESDRLRREKLMKKNIRFVNFCPCLSLLITHISLMELHTDWLGEERM